MRNNRTWPALLVLALLLALSPASAAPVIPRGVDTFTTLADGNTFYDFAQNPIPAGFFCKRSAAFTGRIALRGVPLATDVPGALHGRDTVLERLDDATFNEAGVAVTRLQFKALSLASIAPLKTACGSFHVFVSLAGKQRATTMRIVRTSDQGGTFTAPLAVDARMTFIPVKARAGAAAPKLELAGKFTFPAKALPWTHEAAPRAKSQGMARVDTNGDQTPDTLVFGTANFFPGRSPNAIIPKTCYECEPYSCHTIDAQGKQHCTGPVLACDYPYTTYCP